MPLDLDVPRNFGTLDDISADEGKALSPPPEIVAQLTEAGERVASAGLEADLMWRAGEPGRAILDAANEMRAQVIVPGEHPQALRGNLFGAAVAAEVRGEAGCALILAGEPSGGCE